MFSACAGEFGSPDHVISFEACYEDGSPVTNSIFLPSADDNLEKTFWNWQGKAYTTYPRPDQRTLCFSLTKDPGETLDRCTDAMDIMECILHSMLGWLTLYQNGFLHKDISIGDIIKLKTPLKRKNFSALSVNNLLFQSPDSLTSFETMRAAAGNDQVQISIIELAQEVEQRTERLTSDQLCKAIWIDGDMTTDMSSYFGQSNDGTRLGTYEFVSRRLLNIVQDKLHYVHSPTDDMESFFWVGLWATLRNKNFSRTFTTEQQFAASLTTEGRDSTAIKIRQDSSFIATRRPKRPYSALLRAMAPVLSEWYTTVNQLQSDYEVEESEDDDEEGHDTDPHLEEKLMLRFHRFAYRGVLEFIKVFENHRETLRKT
ncbi:hypothetical protein EV361DRAFT_955942 [Lentinula raphanica]|nr:hypothetical protein EV361DRAFT_955942 [Lentinula raphanica]